jgi:hypothetical protein
MNPFKIYKKNTRFSFFSKNEDSHLDGEITFLDNRIIVNDSIISIDALDSIVFSGFEDYQGRIISVSDNKLSKGIDNKVMLNYKDGKNRAYYFQLDYRYQMRDIREQLIQYHMAGKLDFLNLVAILGIEGYNAIENFKNELPNGGNIRSY